MDEKGSCCSNCMYWIDNSDFDEVRVADVCRTDWDFVCTEWRLVEVEEDEYGD